MGNDINSIHDVIIIGGGPAGYTAALYCARAGMDTLLVEKLSAGGQMCLTSHIDNYPGFEDVTDGFTLGDKMKKGAEKAGAVSCNAEALSVELKGNIKSVKTPDKTLMSKCVIVATGAKPRKLGVENEDFLAGKGVSYCATCDGMFYKNKAVAVVGGGNSAVSEAIYLSKICTKVFLIHRRDEFRAIKSYQNILRGLKNVEICFNTVVEELIFDNKLEGLKVKDINTNEKRKIACDGLFISIGRKPETDIFKGQINVDKSGYIIADESTKTNIPGVFAAGDVRTKILRQIVTATADGAVASHFAEEYV